MRPSPALLPACLCALCISALHRPPAAVAQPRLVAVHRHGPQPRQVPFILVFVKVANRLQARGVRRRRRPGRRRPPVGRADGPRRVEPVRVDAFARAGRVAVRRVGVGPAPDEGVAGGRLPRGRTRRCEARQGAGGGGTREPIWVPRTTAGEPPLPTRELRGTATVGCLQLAAGVQAGRALQTLPTPTPTPVPEGKPASCPPATTHHGRPALKDDAARRRIVARGARPRRLVLRLLVRPQQPALVAVQAAQLRQRLTQLYRVEQRLRAYACMETMRGRSWARHMAPHAPFRSNMLQCRLAAQPRHAFG